jgi:hypothetical protein
MKRAGIGQWNLTSPTSFRQYYQSLLGKDARNKTTFQDPGQARDILLPGPQGSVSSSPNPLRLDHNRDAMMTVYKLHLKQAAVLILQTPHSYREYLGLTTNVSGLVWQARLREDLRDSPQRRRQLKENYDIIGLETGATSIMDVLERFVVIRGFCDYADGQQNQGVATLRCYDGCCFC